MASPQPRVPGARRELYTALYMASTRTQVYLTQEQRRLIDELRAQDGRPLAAVIRAALDEYLAGHSRPTVAEVHRRLDRSFGSMPDLEVPPRDEWDRFDPAWVRRDAGSAGH
jgi:hypothetical protein